MSGTSFQLTFSGPLGSCTPSCPGFGVRDAQTSTGSGFIDGDPFVSNGNQIVGTLNTGVQPGENLLLDYGRSSLFDQSGAPVAHFTGFTLTNSTPGGGDGGGGGGGGGGPVVRGNRRHSHSHAPSC